METYKVDIMSSLSLSFFSSLLTCSFLGIYFGTLSFACFLAAIPFLAAIAYTNRGRYKLSRQKLVQWAPLILFRVIIIILSFTASRLGNGFFSHRTGHFVDRAGDHPFIRAQAIIPTSRAGETNGRNLKGSNREISRTRAARVGTWYASQIRSYWNTPAPLCAACAVIARGSLMT